MISEEYRQVDLPPRNILGRFAMYVRKSDTGLPPVEKDVGNDRGTASSVDGGATKPSSMPSNYLKHLSKGINGGPAESLYIPEPMDVDPER